MDASFPADDGAFERSLLEAAPAVRRLLQRRSADAHEAEDALQDALARALSYRASYDPARGSVLAWLSRVAIRTLTEGRARTGRGHETLSFEPAAVERGDAATREELARALAGLAEIERVVLLRFHARAESIAELAASLGMPEGTVKSHLHRARRRLAGILVMRGFDEHRPASNSPDRGGSA